MKKCYSHIHGRIDQCACGTSLFTNPCLKSYNQLKVMINVGNNWVYRFFRMKLIYLRWKHKLLLSAINNLHFLSCRKVVRKPSVPTGELCQATDASLSWNLLLVLDIRGLWRWNSLRYLTGRSGTEWWKSSPDYNCLDRCKSSLPLCLQRWQAQYTLRLQEQMVFL